MSRRAGSGPSTIRKVLRKRTLLILPAVLLTVTLLQDAAMYALRNHVVDVPTRVAVVLLLQGVAFTVAATWVTPWLERVVLTTKRGTERHAGPVGLVLFYVLAYGALYAAYYVSETTGVQGLWAPFVR